MGIVILAELNKGRPRSGFDFIAFFNKKFNILFSSGTVYSQLYSLERQGLIKGRLVSNAMVYLISEKGQKIMDTVTRLNLKIQECLEKFKY